MEGPWFLLDSEGISVIYLDKLKNACYGDEKCSTLMAELMEVSLTSDVSYLDEDSYFLFLE